MLRSATLAGSADRHDVLVVDGVVAHISPCGSLSADEVIDCDGAAVIPGLHDHHCHLLATAAALTSVRCGPPSVGNAQQLRAVLGGAASPGHWIRGIDYDEAVAGRLDRDLLDDIRADVPMRIQHRSGALWIVNSLGTQLLDLDHAVAEGIERAADGRPTGRLWRMDGWLRDRVSAGLPDVAAVSNQLASVGVTGVTDASPDLDAPAVQLLTAGPLRQHLVLLGSDEAEGSGYVTGPRKIVVSDHALPSFDELCLAIRTVRPRPVALHCVTRAALVLTLAALEAQGTVPGDRIEHAAVAPPDSVSLLADLGVAVVTQPSLVARRGDDYLDRVDPADRDFLWPFRSFVEAGIDVGCSSDAPYGSIDPWQSIRAATERRTRTGRIVGERERVTAQQALDAFLGDPLRPGGPARTVRRGSPADLVVLNAPLTHVLCGPDASVVRMTVISGEIAYQSG